MKKNQKVLKSNMKFLSTKGYKALKKMAEEELKEWTRFFILLDKSYEKAKKQCDKKRN
jgi:glycerol-3-phosphate responsive antiterminator